MKKKNRRAPWLVILWAVLIVLILILAVMALRPDMRFMAKEACRGLIHRELLKETDPEELSLTTVPADSIDVGTEQMLVNREHTLPSDYEDNVAEYKDSGVYMHPSVMYSYGELSRELSERFGEDKKLYIISSYRTALEQAEIESEQGSDTAMPPEASEHRTGLALDVYFDGFAGRGIINCEAGRYLDEHCCDYGFIVRYPIFKHSVTGIDFEPWHLRYVGLPHSQIICRSGLTLEEYIDSLEYGKFYSYEDYVISRQRGSELRLIADGDNTVSEDNCGGYIVTAKISRSS